MAPDPPSTRFEFPIMLYGMLEECTFEDTYSRVVSWQPHGLSFKIHDRKGFERILPKWFKEKYESFRCLLEQWGFIKLSRGKERGCWYQVNFAHGRKAQLKNISKNVFLKGMPEYMSPRDEPNLSKMATLESSIEDKRQGLKTSHEPKGGDSLASLPSKASSSGNKRSRDDDSTVNSKTSKSSYLAPPPKKERSPSPRALRIDHHLPSTSLTEVDAPCVAEMTTTPICCCVKDVKWKVIPTVWILPWMPFLKTIGFVVSFAEL